MANEPKTKMVFARLSASDRAKLEELAEERGLDLSSFVRMVLKDALAYPSGRMDGRLVQTQEAN